MITNNNKRNPSILSQKMNYTSFFCVLFVLFLGACNASKPRQGFAEYATPKPPDYAQNTAWAALPEQSDAADTLLIDTLRNTQQQALADVFFVHPTILGVKNSPKVWNGDVADKSLNQAVDKTTICYQASLFNTVGRVYAPRYRQAHIHAFYTKDTASANKAFEIAYIDIKNAFQYYLQHYNQGRPIVIASHSQGTKHAARLLNDFFDQKPLQAQLVAAYLVGFPISKKQFLGIQPCQKPDEIGCFCSWRTYRRGFVPKGVWGNEQLAAINPLTWRADTSYAPSALNLGSVLTKGKAYKGLIDAQIHGSTLWVTRPKIPGAFLILSPVYHQGDYNLFYLNVRQNAQLRVNNFMEQTNK